MVASGDELRSEMAPFTGDYFQFLRSELLKKHILTFIVKLYTKLRYLNHYNYYDYVFIIIMLLLFL